MSTSREHQLEVKSVVDETHDSKSFVFVIPDTLKESFKYKPGQFLTFKLNVAGQSLLRCYSMSSAPRLDDFVRVTIKRVENGRASNWLCDHVKPGSELTVMEPGGIFTPPDLRGDFLLCAGGSGITPVLSILRSVLQSGSGKIKLIYANRDEQSVIFAEQLKQLHSEYPERLQVIHWLDSVQGIPSTQQLTELVRSVTSAQAYICGPGPFMDGMVTALNNAGMDSENIHLERFVSLSDGEESQGDNSQETVPVTSGIESAELEIELDGEAHKMHCSGSETLLDAAISAGINAPHSCKSGLCGACMCKLEEGKVSMQKNEALDQNMLDKSFILSCQAVPQSEKVRIRFIG